MKKRGYFITFEGPEGAGKSSQLALAARYLSERGVVCTTTREPGGTPLAEKLREVVKSFHGGESVQKSTELLLFEAARAQHVACVIRPALERGEVVLCDRFTDSTVAYQGGARGIDEEAIRKLNTFACAGLVPDRTPLFDLPPERGFERTRTRQETLGEFDRFEKESLDFHHAVRAAFLLEAEREPERFRVIDADRTKEEIFRSVREALDELVF